MKSQLISANHLWQRRSDVLFLKWNPDSGLQREIDWYLNFCITKALKHKTQSLGQQQRQLLDEVGFEEIVTQEKDDQVICLAPSHFFSKYVVAWMGKDSPSLAEKFSEVMNWLKASRGSVLLPATITTEDFETSLQKLGFDKELLLAVDVNPGNE